MAISGLKARLVFKYNEYIELTILQHKPSPNLQLLVYQWPGFPAIMSRDPFSQYIYLANYTDVPLIPEKEKWKYLHEV